MLSPEMKAQLRMPGGREKLLKQLQVRRDDEPAAARADGR
jgi:hypothetical protein